MPVWARAVNWALDHIITDRVLDRLLFVCPYCDVARRDPTDHCPECHL